MGCCASYEREPRPISIGSPEDVQKVGGASPPQALITLQEAARRQMAELQRAYENSQAGADAARQQRTKSISSNVGKGSDTTQSPPTSGGGSSKRYSHHGSGGDPRRHSQHGSRTENRRSMRLEQR